MLKYMLEAGNVFERYSEKETQLHTDINKLSNNCVKVTYSVTFSPRANYTDRAAAAGRRS